MRHDIRFSVDVVTSMSCEGWIVDFSDQHKTCVLQVYIDNEFMQEVEASFYREDLFVLGISNCHHGFFINVTNMTDKNAFNLKVVYGENLDGDVVLVDKTIIPFHTQIEFLSYLQNKVRFQDCNIVSNNLRVQILPRMIDYLRSNPNSQLFLEDLSKINCEQVDKSLDVVSEVAIIVPIYKGLAETKECLLSVLTSQSATKYKLILISDRSPDVNMLPMLRAIAQVYENVELYDNEINLGFVGTVNRGMELAGRADVVLLNSDTIVSDHWLDGLYYEAYEAQNYRSVGTVTPLSNNATICSFPAFNDINEVIKGISINEIGRLCIKNAHPAVDVPTAHGFCMYIKRQVLDEVGLFDQETFAKGYGEENDFSLRASKLGWRNVATNKSFVLHVGSVSFSENALKYQRENGAKLNAMYPDYNLLIQDFLRCDPMRPLRMELGSKLMVEIAKRYEHSILMICPLDLGGGTMVAIQDLVELLKLEKIACFILSQVNDRFFRIFNISKDIFVDIDIYDEKHILVDLLKVLKVQHIHYQHMIDCDRQIWDIPNLLSLSYDVTLHDYYVICPRANLMSYHDSYCGAQIDLYQCNQCLSDLGAHQASRLSMKDFGANIENWHEFFLSKLKNARKVIVPSLSLKERILKVFDLDNIAVKPHPEKTELVKIVPKAEYKVINIGFLGAIGNHKGLRVIKELCEFIKQNNLDFKISIVGYTSDDRYFENYNFVNITGKYEKKDLLDIIRSLKIDIVFLSSIIPETYSYTYTEALRNGLPILGYQIGSLPERSKDNPYVKLVDLEVSVGFVLKSIQDFLNSLKTCDSILIGKQYPSIWKNYYEQ